MAELEAILLAKLSGAVQWVSCQHAAAMIDVSKDTIQRRTSKARSATENLVSTPVKPVTAATSLPMFSFC